MSETFLYLLFNRMNVPENLIYECIKEIIKRFSPLLEKALSKSKGIEEFLYPYVNVCIFNKLKEGSIARLGQGRVSTETEDKPDFILETESNLILGELKLAKKLNDLIFGYQAGNFDCSEKLAGIVKENEFLGVGSCDEKISGKKKIKDGFLVDILKLRNFILKYKILEQGEKNISSVAIGIVKFQNEYKECIEPLKERLENGMKTILQEQCFLPYFEEEEKRERAKQISNNINFDLKLEEFEGFILLKCDVWIREPNET